MRFVCSLCAIALFAGFAAPAGAQPFPFEQVIDISPGSGNGLAGPFVKLGDLAYFWGIAPDSGGELWVTDGTEAGTHIVKDLIPGAAGSGGGNLFEFKGRLFFPYQLPGEDQRIFTSDGTEAGTVPFYPDLSAQGTTVYYIILHIGEDAFYFSAYGTLGNELFISDGTVGGTGLVEDINPNAGSSPQHTIGYGDGILFTADDGEHGFELWKSFGTAETTEMVLDNVPGPDPGYPSSKHWDGTRLFAVFEDPDFGEELFVSDANLTSFTRITDLVPGEDSGVSTFVRFVSFKGEVFFTGFNGVEFDTELFKTDGTPEGTELVADIYPGPIDSGISGFRVIGDYLYFGAASPTVGYEIFRTDGTGPGTTHVTDVKAGPGSSNAGGLTLISDPGFEHYGMFILSATNDAVGSEPYLSDGTPGGTVLAANIASSTAHSSPSWFTFMGEKLIFHANQPGLGFELYSMTLPRRAGAETAWRRYR